MAEQPRRVLDARTEEKEGVNRERANAEDDMVGDAESKVQEIIRRSDGGFCFSRNKAGRSAPVDDR